MHSVRRRGKTRSRVLYWFRTPPNVKVGRAPLDEDAIRLLEEHHPSVAFDWGKILKPPTLGARRADVRKAERRGGTQAGRRPRSTAAVVGGNRLEIEEKGEQNLASTVASETALVAYDDAFAAVAAGAWSEGAEEGGEKAPQTKAVNPVEALLGREGLARLRGRYAELLARIAQQVADPIRQEQLRALAERLNPDGWVTADEARRAIDRFEADFETLRAQLGRRRRRSRRAGRRRRRPSGGAPPPGVGQGDER